MARQSGHRDQLSPRRARRREACRAREEAAGRWSASARTSDRRKSGTAIAEAARRRRPSDRGAHRTSAEGHRRRPVIVRLPPSPHDQIAGREKQRKERKDRRRPHRPAGERGARRKLIGPPAATADKEGSARRPSGSPGTGDGGAEPPRERHRRKRMPPGKTPTRRLTGPMIQRRREAGSRRRRPRREPIYVLGPPGGKSHLAAARSPIERVARRTGRPTGKAQIARRICPRSRDRQTDKYHLLIPMISPCHQGPGGDERSRTISADTTRSMLITANQPREGEKFSPTRPDTAATDRSAPRHDPEMNETAIVGKPRQRRERTPADANNQGII